MDGIKKEYVVIHVDDDIQIKLSCDKFKELDKSKMLLLFDFEERVMAVLPHDAFRHEKGE